MKVSWHEYVTNVRDKDENWVTKTHTGTVLQIQRGLFRTRLVVSCEDGFIRTVRIGKVKVIENSPGLV